MIQQWDFPVDEPVSLSAWRQHRLAEQLPRIAARIERGETLRAVAAEFGISHESLRQTLRRAGLSTRPTVVPAAPLRRVRSHRLPGRGRSTALAPEAIVVLLVRHRAGESIRALARASGVSHETMRRALSEAAYNGAKTTTA